MFQWGLCALGALCLLSACHEPANPQAVNNGTVKTSAPTQAHVTAAHVPKSLEWASCHGSAYQSWFTQDIPSNLQCATLDVPLSYEALPLSTDTAAQRVTLALTRLPATQHKQGGLVVVAGGPGESGVNPSVAPSAANAPLLAAYDIIGYAPRGVAPSTPTISCPVAAHEQSDSTVSENEQFVRSCIEHTGLDVLKHISTRDAVNDLEQIRKALGNEKLTAIGYSYGTKVVASYAEQFPQSVRALVLDGVVDLSEDYFTQRINQEKGFQATFERFAAYCARERACFLSAEPQIAETQFHQLLRQLESKPVIVDANIVDANTRIGVDEVLSAMGTYLLWDDHWPDLAHALQALKRGSARPFAQLMQQLPNEAANDALGAINCADGAVHMDKEHALVQWRRVDEAATFGDHRPKTEAELLESCHFWPHPGTDQARIPIVAKDLPKLLFVAQRHDPTTPYQNAVRMAQYFNSPLLTREGDGHTLALSGVSSCVDQEVVAYLLHNGLLRSGYEAKDRSCAS